MKRNFTIVTVLMLLSIFSFSQIWVNTNSQKKNVLLEEYTGVRCVWCPAGHKIADQLKNQNPNRFWAVNIHTGGFATPGAGDLDLRTNEGNAMAAPAGIAGYPAGSVNRSTSPWARNRGEWEGIVSNQLTQNAIVNVFVKSSIDFTTSKLTTEVELYFTGNAPTSSTKLTVLLLQNDILGPQVGGVNNYPENMVGNDYLHQHALRMGLNNGDALGELIDTATMGHYVYRKYETTLPSTIGNVPLKLTDLEVVAFVSTSNNNNVLNVHGSKVEFDASSAVDLALKVTPFGAPNQLCVAPFKPKVNVTNPSTHAITSLRINGNINGISVSKNWTGTLNPNESVDIEMDQNITPRGAYSFSTSGVTNINGGMLEEYNIKNNLSTESGIGFQSVVANRLSFNFDAPNMPVNLGIIQNENRGLIVYYNTNNYGHGKTPGTILQYLHNSWAIANKPGHIVIGEMDFSNVGDPMVEFMYAYSDGNLGGTAPKIGVSFSADCGQSWTDVETITPEQTGQPATPTALYNPNLGEHKKVRIDMPSAGNKNVLVRITTTPGTHGNALLIDDIKVGSAAQLVSAEYLTKEGFKIYPNPALNNLNIELIESGNYTVELININGVVINNYNFTGDMISLDVANIPTGVYIVKVSSEQNSIVQRIVISH